ncbi:MAG: glycosyltransferase family 2 protein [Candidatus Saganbacteria bacterium]|nr:glycosyltransferase family 2 protein [Candidatus Saganbacteria bacterium]
MHPPKIGVAIATHNKKELLRECLLKLYNSDYANIYVVVVDDGSIDDTVDMVNKEFPLAIVLQGDGNLWWTGATNLAIEKCLGNNCDYIFLLNPDVMVFPETLSSLLENSEKHAPLISAALVMSYGKTDLVWWGGAKKIFSSFPFWALSLTIKRGADIRFLSLKGSYVTNIVHGRGVLVPRLILEKIGLYDQIAFPHYGADVDFSARVIEAGFEMQIVPGAKVFLRVESTGHPLMALNKGFLKGYYDFMFDRKSGETAKVWWYLLKKHVSWYSRVPAYLFILLLNTFRYWLQAAFIVFKR